MATDRRLWRSGLCACIMMIMTIRIIYPRCVGSYSFSSVLNLPSPMWPINYIQKIWGFSYRLHHSQSWMTVFFSRARRLLHKPSLMMLLYWKASRLHHKQASLMLCQLTVSEAQRSQFRILWLPIGRLLVCLLYCQSSCTWHFLRCYPKIDPRVIMLFGNNAP